MAANPPLEEQVDIPRPDANPNMFDEQGRPRFDENGNLIHYRIVEGSVNFKGVGRMGPPDEEVS